MYLPRTLPLCEPHLATWVGKSGRRYDFAVSRPAATWLDEAAVFLLVRSTADHTDVLHIGHTCSLHKRFGAARDRCPEIWRRALAAGMTHVHLRFEACSERARQTEVDDLAAVLKPSLGLQPVVEDLPPAEAPPALAGVGAEAFDEDVLIPYRARLKVMRMRDPHIDIEAFDADLARPDLPFGHAFEPPRSHRFDPARECDVIHDDVDAVAPPAVLAVDAGVPVVILAPTPESTVPLPEPAAIVLPDAAPVLFDVAEAPGSPAVVSADPAWNEAPAEPASAPLADAEGAAPAPVAAAAEPASGPPEPANAAGAAVIAGAGVTGGEQQDPAPRGKERSPGLLGRLLHAMVGRRSRWFGAAQPQPQPQPAEMAMPSSAPAGSAASAGGDGGEGRGIAAMAMTAEATPDAPAGMMGAEHLAVAEAAVDGRAVAEREVARDLGPASIEVSAPLDTVELPVAPAQETDAAGASLAAADPLPAAAEQPEWPETAPPADGDMPPAQEETAQDIAREAAGQEDALAVLAPAATVPLAVAPIPAVGREAHAAVQAADATAQRLADKAAKRSFGCDPGQPLVLFADAICGEAGADILVEAVFTVCSTDAGVQFVFAGEGELRGELCWRVGAAGLGERCRFLGDVACERFRELMLAADILVIPARAGRGDGLASRAIRHGRWVLATHQAQVGCVVHGENGLLTYDNPGSLVWGIRELLERVRRQQVCARAEAA